MRSLAEIAQRVAKGLAKRLPEREKMKQAVGKILGRPLNQQYHFIWEEEREEELIDLLAERLRKDFTKIQFLMLVGVREMPWECAMEEEVFVRTIRMPNGTVRIDVIVQEGREDGRA